MMRELVVGTGQPTDGHQGKLAEFRVELRTVAQFVGEPEKAAQEIGRVGDDAMYVAGLRASLLDKLIEDFAIRVG